MIINDLQYIETATETEVQGGYKGYNCYYPCYYEPKKSANATSYSSADAYGKNTYTSTYNNAFADSDFGYSSSSGGATASASS